VSVCCEGPRRPPSPLAARRELALRGKTLSSRPLIRLIVLLVFVGRPNHLPFSAPLATAALLARQWHGHLPLSSYTRNLSASTLVSNRKRCQIKNRLRQCETGNTYKTGPYRMAKLTSVITKANGTRTLGFHIAASIPTSAPILAQKSKESITLSPLDALFLC